MTLSRANALNWGFNEKLTSAQINLIDSQIPYAIDGHAGGTYNPSSVIHLGGSGIDFTVPITGTHLDLSAGLHVTAATTTIDGALVINSSSAIFSGSSSTQFIGATEFKTTVHTVDSGGSFHFTGGSTSLTLDSGALLHVATQADFSGGALITGATPWLVQSGATFEINGGTLEISGGLSTLKIDHGARINKGKLDLNNADQSIDVTDGPTFIVIGIGADRNYSIQNTSATTGDELEFYCINTSNDGIIKDQAGNVLAHMRQVTSGKVNYLRVRYSGTAWIVAALSANP